MLRSLAIIASALIPLTITAPVGAAPTVGITSSKVEVDQSPSFSTDQLFDIGSATFRKDATAVLDEIAKALIKEGKSNVVIDVHTDDVAPDGDRTGGWLEKLSQARADAIRTYLVRKGVPAARLSARGRGGASPIASNGSESGRQGNRRVEMTIEVDVRPPVAADLATYTKNLRGTGSILMATIDTSMGTLHCQLYDDKAPITVANFIGLATGQKPWVDPKTGKTTKNKPFYDGLVFHRVIPGFMIQGGDPLGAGTGGPGYQFGDEPYARNTAGSMAMANAGPRTNGSQFFINEVASPHLDGRHTVFGQCREVELVSKIGGVARDERDRPQTPVVIKRVTIAKVAQVPAAPEIGPRQR
jgi:peptidyl-prolyl cis-trans isomerase A (cyclophilin A)